MKRTKINKKRPGLSHLKNIWLSGATLDHTLPSCVVSYVIIIAACINTVIYFVLLSDPEFMSFTIFRIAMIC